MCVKTDGVIMFCMVDNGLSNLAGRLWCVCCGSMREFMYVHPCLLLYQLFFPLLVAVSSGMEI